MIFQIAKIVYDILFYGTKNACDLSIQRSTVFIDFFF